MKIRLVMPICSKLVDSKEKYYCIESANNRKYRFKILSLQHLILKVMIVNMKKNKKFQKEQLAEQGYTDITEVYNG